MPRRQFLADLKEISSLSLPDGILSVEPGADDGQFDISWHHSDKTAQITAIVSDVSDYPSSHEYMLFCSDDTTHDLAVRLNNIQRTNRKTVLQLVELLATELVKASTPINNNADYSDDSRGSASEDEDNDMSEADDDGDDDAFLTGATAHSQALHVSGFDVLRPHPVRRADVDAAFRERLKTDLRAAKDAGFRVGVLGDLPGGLNGFLAISVRISKLGLSEEAMLAWQISPSEYLTLLLYYPGGYITHEQVQANADMTSTTRCSMRIFSSKTYKPTLKEAVMAFQKAADSGSCANNKKESEVECHLMQDLKMTFLSRPFIRLLNEDLVAITRLRDLGMFWAGAESWYRDRETMSLINIDIPNEYYADEVVKNHYPDIVTADQYTDIKSHALSFPLVAMQFTLRHFVRCTEFCVVCHRKVTNDVEAIKPFVCERPLCLFQYMTMGFGPSIEHEIMSQPYVVDLLISFCYASASQRKLKDLPVGLGIKVPNSQSIEIAFPAQARYRGYDASVSRVTTAPEQQHDDVEEYDIGFDRVKNEVHFLDRNAGGCPVARGSWIVIRIAGQTESNSEVLHCRVTETNFFPIIRVDQPVHVSILSRTEFYSGYRDDQIEVENEMKKADWTPCTLRKHDVDFDSLTQEQKCDSICQLLLILPSVKDMQAYLQRSTNKDLKRWTERVPASALQILQWIIASNRACIMQVDDKPPGETADGVDESRPRDRLCGMPGYMQFRFAMGAPDKEERFLSEVKSTTRRLKLQYPTIFAWHGSPLHNWHMIIREGLHYKNRDHGRAYGDGVYHAIDAATSLGYTAMGGVTVWPNSVLKISSAMALNELVNAPTEFQSSQPYYVVKQLDWIQTRYLLVSCQSQQGGQHSLIRADKIAEKEPKHVHPQDPSRTPRGIGSAKIVIPASAIKTGRQSDRGGADSPSKRLKDNKGNMIMLEQDNDLASIASDDEDEAALSTPSSQGGHAKKMSVEEKCAKIALNEEDFIPGELNYETLPLMPMPTYANSGTTRRLMNEIKALQTALDNTPQRELGWYVNTSRVDNVYQWIVELHSFHTFEVKGKRLPMADDMKRQKIKSVVLEIRFGADYPFSPPYVRVVRPRFLTFNQGGGGHIVMGGAMCMELLTNTGWSGINSMESVLLQVRMAMASEPFARLDTAQRGNYGIAEAAEGFIRACRTHGWVEPPGFKDIAYGMPAHED